MGLCYPERIRKPDFKVTECLSIWELSLNPVVDFPSDSRLVDKMK